MTLIGRVVPSTSNPVCQSLKCLRAVTNRGANWLKIATSPGVFRQEEFACADLIDLIKEQNRRKTHLRNGSALSTENLTGVRSGTAASWQEPNIKPVARINRIFGLALKMIAQSQDGIQRQSIISPRPVS
jgi:hypothetical protein